MLFDVPKRRGMEMKTVATATRTVIVAIATVLKEG